MTQSNPLHTFAQDFPVYPYDKNHVIVAAGVESHFFYFIESGAVRMTRISKEGKSAVFHIFFPGSVFSLLTLITDNFNQYDFTTQVPTQIRKIPRRQFQEFLQSHPQATYDLNLNLLRGLAGLLKRIEAQVFMPAYNQVAGLLLYFSSHFSTKNQTPPLMHVTITHQEIAEWLGLSRENVSLHMKQLEKNGLISLHQHHIQLDNPIELKKLSDVVESF